MPRSALKESPISEFDLDPINRALVIYSGFGKSPFPRARSSDLVAEFGPDAAAELKNRILTLYAELQQPMGEGEKRSRKSVSERAAEQVAARHPEVGGEGLRVLAWIYGFGLR